MIFFFKCYVYAFMRSLYKNVRLRWIVFSVAEFKRYEILVNFTITAFTNSKLRMFTFFVEQIYLKNILCFFKENFYD